MNIGSDSSLPAGLGAADLEKEILVDYTGPLVHKSQTMIEIVHLSLALDRPFVRSWVPAEALAVVTVTSPKDRLVRLFLQFEPGLDVVADTPVDSDLIDAEVLASD